MVLRVYGRGAAPSHSHKLTRCTSGHKRMLRARACHRRPSSHARLTLTQLQSRSSTGISRVRVAQDALHTGAIR